MRGAGPNALLPLAVPQSSLWSKSRRGSIAQPRQLGWEAADPPAEPGKGGIGTEGRGGWLEGRDDPAATEGSLGRQRRCSSQAQGGGRGFRQEEGANAQAPALGHAGEAVGCVSMILGAELPAAGAGTRRTARLGAPHGGQGGARPGGPAASLAAAAPAALAGTGVAASDNPR